MSHNTKKYQEIAALIPSYKTRENLQRIYELIDYTNLSSYSTSNEIKHLCEKAIQPEACLDGGKHVAAVCVYNLFISTCKSILQDSEIKICSVSAGFPHSQTFNEVKFLETELAIRAGADEIDVVLNLSAFLNNLESAAFDEIKILKQICGNKTLKVILETSFLKTESLINQASLLALEAGADFIKTSTGKDGSIATPEAFMIMAESVKSFYKQTGKKAGLKAAGGISNPEEALMYYILVSEELGAEWLKSSRLRIGASRLVDNLLKGIDTC